MLAVHRWYQAGLGAFVVSSGFAGMCAVLVGAATLYGVLRSVAANREAARAEHWQEHFAWVFEHATSSDRQSRLPPEVAIAMFDQLLQSARGSLEEGVVTGVLEMFQNRTSSRRRR